jgi:hypothetical protein
MGMAASGSPTFWVSGTDVGCEGKWAWCPNGPAISTTSGWATGEYIY